VKEVRLNFNGNDINKSAEMGSVGKLNNSSHISPIRSISRNTNTPQKTANRLFGGMASHSGFQNVFSIQNNVEPLDVLYDFSSIAK